MSKAEKFIEENTRNCSQLHYNSYCTLRHCITPDQAREAVEIAREEMIDKAIRWIKEINTHHFIMRYSDSCESPLSELTEWFKNYMKEGGKDE